MAHVDTIVVGAGLAGLSAAQRLTRAGQTIRVLEARGCYGGRLGAGVLTQYGKALAAPIGRIHWAGAETSDVWNGYMDGAIRSEHRAAEAILDGAR
ncbi:FAD-dependent oxidoreductase [Gordonia iterans]